MEFFCDLGNVLEVVLDVDFEVDMYFINNNCIFFWDCIFLKMNFLGFIYVFLFDIYYYVVQ